MDIQEAIEHLNDVLNDDDRWTDCAECKEEHEQLREFLEELQQYRQIGTVEECMAAREKQIPMHHHHTRINKEPIETRDSVCPSCLGVTRTALNEFPKYCSNCGQKFKWSD